ELLAAHPAIQDLALSRFHETAPIGGPPGQEPFINAAAAFDTTLSPESLHALLGQIERDLGRTAGDRWAARAVDLDLLLYGEAVVEGARLVVPHPRMAFRRFVLAPAAEVAGEMIHPHIGWSVGQLLAHLDDAAAYVALLGVPGSEKMVLPKAWPGRPAH